MERVTPNPLHAAAAAVSGFLPHGEVAIARARPRRRMGEPHPHDDDIGPPSLRATVPGLTPGGPVEVRLVSTGAGGWVVDEVRYG